MVTTYIDLPDERTAATLVERETHHDDYCDCGGSVDCCTYFALPFLNLKVRIK